MRDDAQRLVPQTSLSANASCSAMDRRTGMSAVRTFLQKINAIYLGTTWNKSRSRHAHRDRCDRSLLDKSSQYKRRGTSVASEGCHTMVE